ncbi:MAG: alanine--tRNA ligase [Nanoarchaeota archaeon]|nr:alanine--tRNA ligase [Nanoarchaeota archaeon]
MNRKQLIKKYLDFFRSKNHKVIPSASLVPENDPTVLFTTAGMHPLVPFLLGESHPEGPRITNVQKCIRTGDIDEVGDESHHTFFEMLGNWSLGDYFKKEAIEYSFEFLTNVLEIPIEKLAVTCFKGDKDAPKDNEAAGTWESLGIPKQRIAFLGKKDNWWIAGNKGPCGPDTEMFYWIGKNTPKGNVESNPDEWREIWNDVFMQYNKTAQGKYEPLKQMNVDTGMGVERTVAILNGVSDHYLTDTFLPIIKKIEKLSKQLYPQNQRTMRIIADHVKASVMIIAAGIKPSNTEHGYVLRRLIRRAFRYAQSLDIKTLKSIAESVFPIYEEDYPELKNKKEILKILVDEEENFKKTLQQGLSKFEQIAKQSKNKTISGEQAFLLYQSYGFPIEMTEDLAQEHKLKIDLESYNKEQEKHQELSRTSSAGKFKSGLADNSKQTAKLHTATHLLQAALKKVLGYHIQQKGSNITSERLRFDFTHSEKMTDEQKKETEDLVNQWIQESHEVKKAEMTPKEAKESGAMGLFDDKYGNKVSVFTIGEEPNNIISKEICTGPHVSNTREIGHFKIKKEESSSQGVRRIKAVLE